MFPGCVEMFLLDVELAVGSAHVSPLVEMRASGDHCDKLFLATSLLIHVGFGEKMVDFWISQHYIVEFIHDCADGSFSSQLVKERCHRKWKQKNINQISLFAN